MYKKAHAAIRKDPEHKKPAAKKVKKAVGLYIRPLVMLTIALFFPGGQEEVDRQEAHARREEGQGG